jgi:indolepyruvate ferredoxin oxidoreductase
LLHGFKWLAKARALRGSWLDPFRFGKEKTLDRQLLANYEADLDLLLQNRGMPVQALQLAGWPAEVRGFGPIKAEAAEHAGHRRRLLREQLA